MKKTKNFQKTLVKRKKYAYNKTIQQEKWYV